MSDNQDITNKIQEFEKDIEKSEKFLETNIDTTIRDIIDNKSNKFKVRYSLTNSDSKLGSSDYSHLLYEYELINTTFVEQIDRLEEKLKIEKNDIIFLKTEHTKEDAEKLKTIENDLIMISDYHKDKTDNLSKGINIFLRNIHFLEGTNLRCNEIDYYRNDNPDKPLYIETFEYSIDTTKGVVSELKATIGIYDTEIKLYIPTTKVIGNRFYPDDYLVSGVSNTVDNSFTILSFNPEHKTDYRILEIENENDNTRKRQIIQKCNDTINHILETRVRDKLGYEIDGNKYLTIGYTTALQSKLSTLPPDLSSIVIGDQLNFYNPDNDDSDNNKRINNNIFEERLKVYFKTNDDGTFKEPRTLRDEYKNKIIVVPVSTPGHATVILIDCFEGKEFKDRIKYFDSSTAACEPNLSAKNYYFGDYSEYIEVLNQNMQINGTCTYWSDCFMKILVEDQFSDPRKYDTIDKIKTAFQDGTMQLDICVEMSNIFDKTDKLVRTVIRFPVNNDHNINVEAYKILQRNGNNYGIDKDVLNINGNRFLYLDGIAKYLDENEKTDDFEKLVKAQNVSQKINYYIREIDKRINNLNSDKHYSYIFKDCFELNFKTEEEAIIYYNNKKNENLDTLNYLRNGLIAKQKDFINELNKYINNGKTFSESLEEIDGINSRVDKQILFVKKNEVYNNIEEHKLIARLKIGSTRKSSSLPISNNYQNTQNSIPNQTEKKQIKLNLPTNPLNPETNPTPASHVIKQHQSKDIPTSDLEQCSTKVLPKTLSLSQEKKIKPWETIISESGMKPLPGNSNQGIRVPKPPITIPKVKKNNKQIT